MKTKKKRNKTKSTIELLSDIMAFFEGIPLQAIRDNCNKLDIKVNLNKGVETKGYLKKEK